MKIFVVLLYFCKVAGTDWQLKDLFEVMYRTHKRLLREVVAVEMLLASFRTSLLSILNLNALSGLTLHRRWTEQLLLLFIHQQRHTQAFLCGELAGSWGDGCRGCVRRRHHHNRFHHVLRIHKWHHLSNNKQLHLRN